MQKLEKLIFDLIDKDKWQEAIDHSWRMPANWGLHQRMPSIKEMPDYAINSVLDKMTDPRNPHSNNLSSFLFELASNMPKNAGNEVLNRINKISNDDFYVKQALENHPNFKLDEHASALDRASNFWREYEGNVATNHFATIKSMYSGKKEEMTSHRGESGSSDSHSHIIPDLREYSKAVQDKMLSDKFLIKKYIKGEPHIKVYRGVNGNYGKKIREAVSYDPENNQAVHKRINIPTSSFSSWTSDPQIARQFVSFRDSINGQPGQHGVVLSKWMPVKDILHSGYHKVQAIQKHGHPAESELVFGHPSGKMRVMSSEMEFQHPNYDSTVSPEIIQDVKKSESVDLEFMDLSKSVNYKKPLATALTALAMMGCTKDFVPSKVQSELSKPIEKISVLEMPAMDKIEPHPELKPIQMIECRQGRPCGHKPVQGGLHQGTHAIGHYGLMPVQIVDTVKRDPTLKSKYPILSSLHHLEDFDKIKEKFNKYADIETEVANSHWDYLKNRFNSDKDRMAYAWLNGVRGTLNTPEDEIRNHWYVKRYKKFENLNKLKKDVIKKSEILKDKLQDYIVQFNAFHNHDREVQKINFLIDKKQIKDLSNIGKFTKNSFVVGYNEEDSWLLKLEPRNIPKSESVKHTGLQTFKEAAFYDVARQVFGLYDFVPKAVLGSVQFNLLSDNSFGITNPNWPAVAIKMLPESFKLAQDVDQEDPKKVMDILEFYRRNGDVHKISAMLWILGETDAHGNNLMTDGVNIVLIDHGSAFADLSFDPVKDDSVFVPYVLRTGRFTEWDTHEIKNENIAKIDSLSVKQDLKQWLLSIDPHILLNIMKKYDLDPSAVLIRLKYMQSLVKMSEHPDEVINELWLRGMNLEARN